MSYWECLQVSEILCLYNCHRVIRPCMLQGLSFQWALLLQSFPLHFLCFFTLFLSFKSSWHWQLIFKSHLIIAMATVGCSKFWTNAGIVQLSAFPSLRGTPAFTWHRRWRESPELLSLVDFYLLLSWSNFSGFAGPRGWLSGHSAHRAPVSPHNCYVHELIYTLPVPCRIKLYLLRGEGKKM